jgi:hypothetical protein
VWAHPDLLPTASDLDDPLGFRENMPSFEGFTDEAFDEAIAELLDGEGPDQPDEPGKE